jgi:hypothetical protein
MDSSPWKTQESTTPSANNQSSIGKEIRQWLTAKEANQGKSMARSIGTTLTTSSGARSPKQRNLNEPKEATG